MRTASPAMRVALLSLAIAVAQLATSLYLPSLPAMAHRFGIGPAAASLTLTVFYVGFAVCNLVAGPLADAIGRRPVLLGGLGLFLVGTVMCAMAPSIPVFMLGRLVQAAGASAAPVVGRAMLRDSSTGSDGTRAMIWVSIAMAASPALGPPLGGLIQQDLDWRWAFWSLAIGDAAIMILIVLTLGETLPPESRMRPHGLFKRYVGLLGDRIYGRNVGALSFLFAGLGAFFAAGPFLFIRELHFSPVGYGLLNIINVVGYLAGSTTAGRLSKRLEPAALVRWGTLIGVVGGVLMVALAAASIFAAWSILLPVSVIVFGFGMVLPAATAGALDRHPAQAGLASAMLGFLQILAAAAGTLVVGQVINHGILAVSTVFLALTVLAFLSARKLASVT